MDEQCRARLCPFTDRSGCRRCLLGHPERLRWAQAAPAGCVSHGSASMGMHPGNAFLGMHASIAVHPWQCIHGNAVPMICPLWGWEDTGWSSALRILLKPEAFQMLLVQLWAGCSLCSSARLCFDRAALILFHFFLWICTCCAPKAHWAMVSSEGSPPTFHRHFFTWLPHSRSFLLKKGY